MSNQLPTPYQQFIAKSRYARWLESENRREDWSETVDRYMENVVGLSVGEEEASKLSSAILGLRSHAVYACYDDCWSCLAP